MRMEVNVQAMHRFAAKMARSFTPHSRPHL
jgi:hypothetical protein